MQAATFAGPSIPSRGSGGSDAGGGPEPSQSRSLANIAGALARFEKEQAGATLEARIAETMDALSTLARYLAGFPGRKSVIWFSGSFPPNAPFGGSQPPKQLGRDDVSSRLFFCTDLKCFFDLAPRPAT